MLIVMLTMVAVIVIIFVFLIVFMKKVLSSEVSSKTIHLDSLREEYAQKEEALRKQLEDAKRQSQDLLAAAQKDAQTQKEILLKQAEEEKEHILAQANQKADEIVGQADKARLALLGELEEQIDQKAVVKAVELLAAALPERVRSEIHERWVNDLIMSSFEHLERLKIPEGEAVKITTAFELNGSTREKLLAKIKEKLGRELKLQEVTDPSIIAGMVVMMGSLHLDGSLKFRIQEAARAT